MQPCSTQTRSGVQKLPNTGQTSVSRGSECAVVKVMIFTADAVRIQELIIIILNLKALFGSTFLCHSKLVCTVKLPLTDVEQQFVFRGGQQMFTFTGIVIYNINLKFEVTLRVVL